MDSILYKTSSKYLTQNNSKTTVRLCTIQNIIETIFVELPTATQQTEFSIFLTFLVTFKVSTMLLKTLKFRTNLAISFILYSLICYVPYVLKVGELKFFFTWSSDMSCPFRPSEANFRGRECTGSRTSIVSLNVPESKISSLKKYI